MVPEVTAGHDVVRSPAIALTARNVDGFDMMIDTRRSVEVEGSPARMFGLAMLGVLMTALSAAVALHAFPNVPPGSFAEFFGYVGTVFFGACTVLLLWRAFTTRGPVVTITPDGIHDSRVAAEFIPWSAVSDINVWESNGQRVMVLAVDPAVEAGLGLTRIARWTRGANRALGADGLCVTAQGLKMGFDELLATSLAYGRAWHAGAAAAPAPAADDKAHLPNPGGAKAQFTALLLLDAPILPRRCAAGHHAGLDHRHHGAFRVGPVIPGRPVSRRRNPPTAVERRIAPSADPP
jgi:hypothetical protein